MDKQNMEHLDYIAGVVNNDIRVILEKESMYWGSWKARGGIGAFFITARKWDALENMLEKNEPNMYDIFDACVKGGAGDGSPLEQVRDLRRYLTLIEAEVIRLKAPKPSVPVTTEEGLTLKGQGPYGTGEEINTEYVNDRTNKRPSSS